VGILGTIGFTAFNINVEMYPRFWEDFHSSNAFKPDGSVKTDTNNFTQTNDKEIDALIAKGIATRKTFAFTPVSFSDNLVPAGPLGLKDGKPGSFGLYHRGTVPFQVWIAKTPANVALSVRGGIIYQSRGAAKLALFPRAEPEGKAVAEASVPPERKHLPVRLTTEFTGLHRLDLSDHAAGTAVEWPAGLPVTVVSSPEQPATLHGRWSLYFYVPKGTRHVGGYSSGVGTMLDGAGKVVHTFPGRGEYFAVPVPPGQDGKLWKMQHSTGQRLLMTVPPCLARSAKELLLPAYSTSTLQLGFTADSGWEAALVVRNLFDQAGYNYISGSNYGAFFGDPRYKYIRSLERPRTISLTFSKKW
jgi:hypothetical protein